jgi:uncharacterized protein
MMFTVNTSSYAKVQFFQRQAASLLLYQSVLENEVGKSFLHLLQTIRYADADGRDCLQAYGHYFQALAMINQNWEQFIIGQILLAANPFTKLAQQQQFKQLPPALVAAARHDLQVLQSLYECNSAVLSEWVQNAAHLPVSPVVWYQESKEENFSKFISTLENWGDAVENLAAYYRKHGTGLFAKYSAFSWQNGQLSGIDHVDSIKLDTLIGYEWQKQALLKNTEFLLAGEKALHILLYGSRGSGKSSLVKSLVNEYSHKQLRLIEVAKSELRDLPQIIQQLRGVPQKFIIFVDDLSFEEDDDGFKAMKVVLEGNLTAKPDNMVVYATSNRRHLIREYFGDRPAPKDHDEVHGWDTMQEKLSFSDRFGLTLTFEAADQPTYLQIIKHLATISEINIPSDELEHKALQWATRHNGRSGRTARQFIDFLKADLALSKNVRNNDINY